MSRSSVLTSRPLAPERPAVRWVVANRVDRFVLSAPLAILIAWFSYTRLYFFLHPLGLTFDPSLFMYLTGRPDPSCGLTRTFAWTWRGDLVHAVLVYPLGPLVFLVAGLVTANLAIAVAMGRRVQLILPRRAWHVIIAVSAAAVAMNWAAKLIWLGM